MSDQFVDPAHIPARLVRRNEDHNDDLKTRVRDEAWVEKSAGRVQVLHVHVYHPSIERAVSGGKAREGYVDVRCL